MLDVFVEVVSRFAEFEKVIADARFVSFEKGIRSGVLLIELIALLKLGYLMLLTLLSL